MNLELLPSSSHWASMYQENLKYLKLLPPSSHRASIYQENWKYLKLLPPSTTQYIKKT